MGKNSFILVVTVFFALFTQASQVLAQELTAKEIIKRQDDIMRGDSSQGRYTMTVVTPSWSRTLELSVWAQNRDKNFLHILSPAKEAGITTLRDKDNMWNYLPSVERVIKVPPSMMLQPWMGSDFANDDLVKESSIVDDYDQQIIAEEEINGFAAYKVKLVPKPQAAVTWGKIVFWVRKIDFVPLREEYYAEDGRMIKALVYSKIRRMSDREIPTVWRMTSMIKPGHQTVITVDQIEYNQPIDQDIFTINHLKHPRQ